MRVKFQLCSGVLNWSGLQSKNPVAFPYKNFYVSDTVSNAVLSYVRKYSVSTNCSVTSLSALGHSCVLCAWHLLTSLSLYVGAHAAPLPSPLFICRMMIIVEWGNEGFGGREDGGDSQS